MANALGPLNHGPKFTYPRICLLDSFWEIRYETDPLRQSGACIGELRVRAFAGNVHLPRVVWCVGVACGFAVAHASYLIVHTYHASKLTNNAFFILTTNTYFEPLLLNL